MGGATLVPRRLEIQIDCDWESDIKGKEEGIFRVEFSTGH